MWSFQHLVVGNSKHRWSTLLRQQQHAAAALGEVVQHLAYSVTDLLLKRFQCWTTSFMLLYIET